MTCVKAVIDSCAAPEATSAPEAIRSAARFNCSAAEAAWLMPEDNCPVAAAMRSAACCCLPSVRALLRWASASRVDAVDDLPSSEVVARATGDNFLTRAIMSSI